MAAAQLLRLPALLTLRVLSHHFPNKQEGIKKSGLDGRPQTAPLPVRSDKLPSSTQAAFGAQQKGWTGSDYAVTRFGSGEQISETFEIKCGR